MVGFQIFELRSSSLDPLFVIPAQAGIQYFTFERSESGIASLCSYSFGLDPSLRWDDGEGRYV